MAMTSRLFSALRKQLHVSRTSGSNRTSLTCSSTPSWNGASSVLSSLAVAALPSGQETRHPLIRMSSTASSRFLINRQVAVSRSNAENRTKKIVERNGGLASSKTLYDPSRETENCGVGLIASLKSIPSRDIVLRADEMLVRMAHRGGCGCDPASGDGSGT
jgi:Glutamine amidotransferases class-II